MAQERIEEGHEHGGVGGCEDCVGWWWGRRWTSKGWYIERGAKNGGYHKMRVRRKALENDGVVVSFKSLLIF
jgi:hypothetical protein